MIETVDIVGDLGLENFEVCESNVIGHSKWLSTFWNTARKNLDGADYLLTVIISYDLLLALKYTNPQIYLIESLYWEHSLRFRFSRARDRGVAASGWLRHHR